MAYYFPHYLCHSLYPGYTMSSDHREPELVMARYSDTEIMADARDMTAAEAARMVTTSPLLEMRLPRRSEGSWIVVKRSSFRVCKWNLQILSGRRPRYSSESRPGFRSPCTEIPKTYDPQAFQYRELDECTHAEDIELRQFLVEGIPTLD